MRAFGSAALRRQRQLRPRARSGVRRDLADKRASVLTAGSTVGQVGLLAYVLSEAEERVVVWLDDDAFVQQRGVHPLEWLQHYDVAIGQHASGVLNTGVIVLRFRPHAPPRGTASVTALVTVLVKALVASVTASVTASATASPRSHAADTETELGAAARQANSWG